MPGITCCVPKCAMNSLLNKGVSFHLFPRNVKEKKYFIKAVNRKGRNKMQLWLPSKYSKICDIHFKKIKKDYNETQIAEAKESMKKYLVNCSNYQEFFKVGAEVIVDQTNKSNFISTSVKNKNQNEIVSHNHDHNYYSDRRVLDLKCDISNLHSKLNDAEKKLEELKNGMDYYKRKYEDALRHIKEFRTSNKDPLSDTEKLIKNEQQLRFYTGFQNKEYFDNFIKLIKPGYKLGVILFRKNERRPHKLTFNQQLLLIFSRLRLGLYEMDLAYRFGVSQTTVSRLCNFWIDFLCAQLTQIPLWPCKSTVQKHMPETLKNKYPNTRVILDCTEIYIETPSDFRVHSATYSNYKSHNTAKGLLGISPNGMVVFVSDLYGGRISDKEIFQSSGLINLLEENDDVMADRGFLIKEILEEKKITLNIPPFLNGQFQFSTEEMLQTKNIAKERITVERVIKHVKSFKILSHVFSNSMSTKLN